MSLVLEPGHHQAAAVLPEPERCVLGMWAAVMHRALEDATGNVLAINSNHGPEGVKVVRRRVQHEAARWFASDARGVGSFLWICSLLDLEPEVVRARAAGVMSRRRIPPPPH